MKDSIRRQLSPDEMAAINKRATAASKAAWALARERIAEAAVAIKREGGQVEAATLDRLDLAFSVELLGDQPGS